MSDRDTSLPIRTENNGDAVVRLVDGLTTTQFLGIDAAGKITVKLTDGSGVSIDSQTINTTRWLEVTTPNNGALGSAAPNRGALMAGTDGVNLRALLTDANGKLAVTLNDGSSNAISSTLINGKQRLDVALSAAAVNGSAVPFSTVLIGGSDGANIRSLSTDSSGQLKVNIKDSSGADFSYTNPLPVYMTEDPGLELQDYNESTSDVAGQSSDTHVYTVPAGKTLKLDQILASASGKMKVLIETSQDGTTFTKLATRFNSVADPSADTDLKRIVSIPAGGKVRVTRTNREAVAIGMQMYSTIIGVLK